MTHNLNADFFLCISDAVCDDIACGKNIVVVSYTCGDGNTNRINKNKQKHIKTLKICSIHDVLDIVWIKVRSKHEKKKLPLKLDTTGNVERER